MGAQCTKIAKEDDIIFQEDKKFEKELYKQFGIKLNPLIDCRKFK
jgi:hypothetical protein